MKEIKFYKNSKSDIPKIIDPFSRKIGLCKTLPSIQATLMSIARLSFLKRTSNLRQLGLVLLILILGACSAPVHKSSNAALATSANVSACLPLDDGSLISPVDCNALYKQVLENMWSYSIGLSGPSPKEQRFSPLLNNGYLPPVTGDYSRFVTFTSDGESKSPAGLLYNGDSNTYQTLKSSNSSPTNVWVSQIEDFRRGFCNNVAILSENSSGHQENLANIAGYATSLLQGLPPIWFNKITQKWVPSWDSEGYKDHGLYVIFLPYTKVTEIPAYKSQQDGTITINDEEQACGEKGIPCIIRVSINGVSLAKGTGTNLYPREADNYDHTLWGVEWSESWPYTWIASASYFQQPGGSFSCGEGELSCIGGKNEFYPWSGLGKTANWIYANDAPSMVDNGTEEFIMPGNLRFKNSGTKASQLLSLGQSFEACDSKQSSFCFIPAAQMEQALCQ